jgi:L-amino acid N-acyltransferase YncA
MNIKTATEEDFLKIRALYQKVYAGNYPVNETDDPEEFERAINDGKHEWLLAIEENDIIGSLILAFDKPRSLVKWYGAAVDPRARRKGVLSALNQRGLESSQNYQVRYAVARAEYPAPNEALLKCGFKPLGIFPNAMKIRKLETHGLLGNISPDAIKNRKTPVLIEPSERIFSILNSSNDLGEAEIVDIDLDYTYQSTEFEVVPGEDVKKEYYNEKSKSQLLFDYYPFFEPNLKCRAVDGSGEVYMYHNQKAALLYIHGLKTIQGIGQVYELLESLADFALQLGSYYIELVVPADNPELQAAAYKANYLPCAYFPAFKKEENLRKDCIIASRVLVVPSFQKLKNGKIYKPFIETYCKTYTKKNRKRCFQLAARS